MRVSVLIGTRNRTEPLLRCLNSVLKQDYPYFEVIVLDDGSDKVDVCTVVKALAEKNEKRVMCVRNSQPLGVAGGRNRLMNLASGDIFCVIDDDAYFTDERSLFILAKVFTENTEVGIIATKVVDYRLGSMRLLVPFPKRVLRKRPGLVENEQDVSYFVGTCHAIRREVIEKCGFYPEDFVYGEEELDFSYRAIEAGFRIRYVPSVVVHHRPELSVVEGRRFLRNPELYHHVKNRILLARKYVPSKFLFSYVTVWMGYYWIWALRELSVLDFLLGVFSGIVAATKAPRTRLSESSVAYMCNHFGRLWY